MPPEFLKQIPQSDQWDTMKAREWASKLKVSTEALAYALKDAGLVSEHLMHTIKATKVPSDAKVDPELHSNLSPRSHQRRVELLSRGLSMSYVKLCFDGYERGLVSSGRLSEMLLLSNDELPLVAELYGRRLLHGD